MAPGKTIVISTHILEEVHAVCTRALIVARGRLLADERPAALEARSRYHGAVTVVLADATGLGRVETALKALPAVAAVEAEPGEARLTALPVPGADLYAAVTALAAREHFALSEIRLEAGRLDEVFRTITTAAEAAP